jgi:hypothetical protein
MWSNDFPHPNSTWPNSKKIIQRDLGHLSPEIQAKVLYQNVCRLYGMEAARLPQIRSETSAAAQATG